MGTVGNVNKAIERCKCYCVVELEYRTKKTLI